MNELEARVECLKVAERISGTDKSVEGLVKSANALYSGLVGEGAETVNHRPVGTPDAAPSPTHNSKRDKAKRAP